MDDIQKKEAVVHEGFHKARLSPGSFEARDDLAGFQQADTADDAGGLGA